jgi:hypothetical protein
MLKCCGDDVWTGKMAVVGIMCGQEKGLLWVCDDLFTVVNIII